MGFAEGGVKGQKYPVEILAGDEVESLMAAFSRKGSAGIRDRSLVCVLWRCGLRISEALDLKLKDIDFQKGTIRVLHGKGDKARTVGIDPRGLAVLELWIIRRKKLGLNGRHPLFCTLPGGKLNPVACRIVLKRAGKKAGIEKRIHPHALRHTMASEMRQEGIEIGIISRQLGHSSIATTSRYLQHVCPQETIDAVRARSW